MPCARHCNEGPQPEVINLSQLEYNKSKCPIEEGTCVLCQEILGVEKDIADTVARLKDLLSHHQRLKTDINRTHSPIIRDLPVEVLSRIFKACFPDNTNDITDDDWEPGHKHVAIPAADWSGVLLSRRFNSSSRVCDQYGIIKEWISRSGALPLNVYVYEEEDEAEDLDVVDYSWERIADECRCWEMSLEILALSSNRWKDATLNLSTYSFECIASTSKLKPPIRNLNLSSSGDCGWQPLESKWKDGLKLWQEFSSSGPQHVTTDLPVRFKTFNLNWQHVRRVETDGWSLQDCLDLLKSSPHLFSCSFAFVLEYEEDPEPRPDEPVTCHASLNELSLQCSDAAHFFDHVTLPSLEVLTYPTDSLKDEPMQKDDPSLMSFFTRSSFPLVALSVAAHMFTPEYMVTILGTIPCLGCLKLSCSDSPELVDDTETVMAFFLEHLAATATFTNEAGSNSSGKFLPELESLELNGAWEFGFFWSIAADIFGDPSEVGAEGRRPLKSLELHTWNLPRLQGYRRRWWPAFEA